MALILNIETSTQVCSVSISLNGDIVAFKESNDEKSHAKLLTIFIDQLLKEQSYSIENFDAIAISKGPGSYTGLRIGVSTAKGLCYAKDIPLIAINTLQSMANGIIQQGNYSDKDIIVPMIDARRMEVYSAFFNQKSEFIRDVKAEIIDENSYQEVLQKNRMIFFGDGSEKIKSVIKHENAVFIEDMNPSSRYMSTLSEEAFNKKKFENVAYFEPFYLKDFIATVPKRNIFK